MHIEYYFKFNYTETKYKYQNVLDILILIRYHLSIKT